MDNLPKDKEELQKAAADFSRCTGMPEDEVWYYLNLVLEVIQEEEETNA